jgi:hypothetical protein
MIREGPVAGLLADGSPRLRVQVSPIGKAEEVLKERWKVSRETLPPEPDPWLIVHAPSQAGPEVVEFLVAHGIQVHQVVARRQTLEEYFLAATRDNGMVDSGVKYD